MKIHFSFFLQLILTVISSAQTFQRLYTGPGDERAYSMKQTADGGYVLAGCTNSFSPTNNSFDFYVIKTDGVGDTLWTKTYGGLNGEVATSIEQTSDGGYIITGVGDSCCSGPAPYHNIWLIKTNSLGDTLWTKSFGTNADEYGKSVMQTGDGGYIITGFTNSFSGSFESPFLLKADSNGNMIWSNRFLGSAPDYANSLCQTSSGEFLIAGFANSFGSGGIDVYVIKTDSNGNLLWAKTYGSIISEKAECIRPTSDGGYIICGWTDFTGDTDGYLIKTDSSGSLLWSKSFGIAGFSEIFSSVEQTTDGGFIALGHTTSGILGHIYLVKTDSAGNFQWSRTFGPAIGEDFVGFSVKQANDTGFIIAATAFTPVLPYWFGDIYLIKTDPSGNSYCNGYQSNIATVSSTPVTTVSLASPSQSTAPFILDTRPRSISAGGIDSIICYSAVGINENISQNNILTYPNPSFGKLTVNKKGEISIYNLLGEKIFSQKLVSEKNEIDLSTHPKGVYFVRVVTEKGSCSQKVVVQ